MFWNIWNITIILVWLWIVVTIVATVVSYQKKKTGITKPINVVFAGMVISTLCGLFPNNYIADALSDYPFFRIIETLSLSLANVMQVFTVDIDGKDLLETINKQEEFCLQQPYILTMSLLCTIAPLLTVGALASALMSLSAGRRYLCSFLKTAYVFSDLNKRSITLAFDLKTNHPNSVIVFTDVVDREEEEFLDLSNRAKSIGAILFKQDILEPKFHCHRKGVELSFFIIGENETENINHSLTIIEKYKNRNNTRLFLFSSTRESELALTGIDKGKIKVRRVNETKSLIYRTLYKKGDKLFSGATMPDNNGIKHINAVILGMGDYGIEMIKALAWFCQMDGYKLSINAFDKDKKAEAKFKTLCPDLLSPNYNGVTTNGESDYSITIHSKIDVNTSYLTTIFETLSQTTPATFVFVSLGSDEENIRVASNMRMIWKRFGLSPIIQTVAKNPKVSKVLADSKNYKGQPYNIDYIGDIRLEYSESVIINSELESIALERHKKWGDEESFWAYEYNYNSSVASVIHKKARDICGVKGTDTLNNPNQSIDALSADERDSLQCLEHRRWNAYMRAEGYVYGYPRDDIAKTHHCLKPYYDLDPSDRKKDIW